MRASAISLILLGFAAAQPVAAVTLGRQGAVPLSMNKESDASAFDAEEDMKLVTETVEYGQAIVNGTPVYGFWKCNYHNTHWEPDEEHCKAFAIKNKHEIYQYNSGRGFCETGLDAECDHEHPMWTIHQWTCIQLMWRRVRPRTLPPRPTPAPGARISAEEQEKADKLWQSQRMMCASENTYEAKDAEACQAFAKKEQHQFVVWNPSTLSCGTSLDCGARVASTAENEMYRYRWGGIYFNVTNSLCDQPTCSVTHWGSQGSHRWGRGE